ncbi:hypothetical protein [Vreelandella sp. EE7]
MANHESTSPASLRAGQWARQGGSVQYCLSPLPLPTDSELAHDVTKVDVYHDDAVMDLRPGSNPEATMMAGTCVTGGGVFVIFVSLFGLWVAAMRGGGYITIFLFIFLLSYIILLVMGNFAIPFMNTALRRTPPVRLNRHRREVAFVVAPKGRFWMPAPENVVWWSVVSFLSAFSVGVALFEIHDWFYGRTEHFPIGFVLIHITTVALMFVYPFIYDTVSRFCKRERRTVIVPWEDVVALAGVSQHLSPYGISGVGWEFELLAPDPERPGYALPGGGLSCGVGGYPGALAQWEYIRCFMEEGPSSISARSDKSWTEKYNDEMTQAKAYFERTNEPKKWRRFRRGKRWELARFAHWYADYREQHILPQAVPRGWLAEWSKPLPPEERATPSASQVQLSTIVRAAYRRGETFSTMGDIEKRFGITSEVPQQTSYPTFPFGREAGGMKSMAGPGQNK